MKATDALSAVSILAAILTFFFGLAREGIAGALRITPADAAKEWERKQQRRDVLTALLVRATPVFIGSTLLWYVCLPETVVILRTSRFDAWHFDLTRSLFVLLELGLSILVLLTSSNVYRLCKKLRGFAKKT